MLVWRAANDRGESAARDSGMPVRFRLLLGSTVRVVKESACLESATNELMPINLILFNIFKFNF